MLSFFARDVVDEILHLIESVSGEFSTYSFQDVMNLHNILKRKLLVQVELVL